MKIHKLLIAIGILVVLCIIYIAFHPAGRFLRNAMAGDNSDIISGLSSEYSILWMNDRPLNSLDSSLAYSCWSHAYGGSSVENACCIQKTSDGGYILAGITQSFGASGQDIWIVKTDEDGNLTWQRRYGREYNDEAWSILQTNEGGYIVAGSTDNYYDNANYSSDVWILKLDAGGNITWQRSYGDAGIGNEKAYSIKQNSTDGSYLVGGYTEAYGAGNGDAWIIKLNSDGTIQWQRTFGGLYTDVAISVSLTADGGSIFTGYTESFGSGMGDLWVVKLDSAGNNSWQRTYGTAYREEGHSIIQTSDSGYAVAGYTNLLSNANQYSNLWVLKLASSGNISWQRSYGSTNYDDYANSIRQTSDGGFIVAGYTNSWGPGQGEMWALKLDSSGNITAEKAFGRVGYDEARCVVQADDGGYTLAGTTSYYGSGTPNFWVVRTDSQLNMDTSCGFVTNTSATVTSTSVSPMSPSLTAATSTASSIVSNGAVQITSGTDTAICVCSDSPGRVGNTLTISKSGTTNLNLSWTAPSAPCVTQDYAIYQGSVPWSGYNHACMLASTGSNTYATLVLGTGSYYYLVVAQYNSQEGSYGLASAGTEIPASTAPCNSWTQHIGTCN